MPRLQSFTFALFLLIPALPSVAVDADPPRLSSADLFELQYARDVEISPDGERVVYARAIHDVTSDTVRSNLWLVDTAGESHRPLLPGRQNYSSPRSRPTAR